MKNTYRLLIAFTLILNSNLCYGQSEAVYNSEFCGDTQNVVDFECTGVGGSYYYQDIEVSGEGIMGDDNRGLIEITVDVTDDASSYNNNMYIQTPGGQFYFLTQSSLVSGSGPPDFPGFIPGDFIFSMKDIPGLPDVEDNIGNPNGLTFKLNQNFNDGITNADGTWLFQTCRFSSTNYIDIHCISLTFGQICPEIIDVTSTATTCLGDNDGSITVEASAGASGEIFYSIDGVNFQEENLFENLSEGTYEVTVAEGEEGGVYSCLSTMEIIVELGDNEAPYFDDDPPASYAIDVDENCLGTFMLVHPIPLDNCGFNLQLVIITYPDGTVVEEDLQPGMMFEYSYEGIGNIEFDWFIQDIAGNDTHEYTTIGLEDNTAPMLDDDPPASYEIDVDENCEGAFMLVHPTPVENCGLNIQKAIITYPDGTVVEEDLQPGMMFEYSYEGTGVIEFDWYLQDIAGNESHDFTTVGLGDNTAPMLDDDPPASYEIDVDENCVGTFMLVHPTPVENCDLNIQKAIITYPDGTVVEEDLQPGMMFEYSYEGTGVIEFDWYLQDIAGNESHDFTTVGLGDNTAPTWTVNSVDIQGECGVDDVEDLRDQAAMNLMITDGCTSDITLDLVSPDPEIIIVECSTKYIYSYTGTDDSNNTSAEAQVMVDIIDSTPPTIEGVPDDVTVYCGDALPEIPIPTSHDLCEGDLTGSIEFLESTTEGNCQMNEFAIIYTYQWTSTDECENISTKEWNVTVINDVSISLGDDFTGCEGSTYFLSPNGLSGEYLWSTGETTDLIEIAESGVYSVTVTTENGCCATSEVIVSYEDLPIAIAIGNTITCEDTEVLIFGDSDVDDVTYSWSGPNAFMSTLQDPLVDTEGEYILTVSTSNECTSSAVAVVDTDTEVPDITATGGSLDCISTSATLSASSSYEGAYSWSGPDSYTSTEQNPTVDLPGQYTVVFTALNGCIASIQVTVEDNITSPQITGEDGILDCTNTSIALSLDGDEDLDYSWTGPNGFESTAQNPTVDNPGTYSVVATDMNGCTATEEVLISEDVEIPNLEAMGGVLTCEQNTAEISATSTTENVTFEWTGPNGFSSDESSVSIGVAGEYTVIVTSENGCTSMSSVQVEADEDLPTITASGGTIDCNNESVQLMSDTDSEGATYLWTGPNGFTSTDPNPLTDIPGTYIIQVSATNGCQAQTEIEVEEDSSPPDLTITTPIFGCNSSVEMILLESDIESTYEWEGPMDFTSTDQNPMIELPGEYTVTATGTNGCTTTESVIVEIDDSLPVAMLTAMEKDCDNNTITLGVDFDNPEYILEWKKDDDPFSSEETIIISEEGMYTLIVTGPNACSIELSYILEEDLTDIQADITTTNATTDLPGTASIMITNSELPVTILWDNGEEGLETSNLEAGPHSVTVTDVFGCTYTFEFEIVMSTSILEISEISKWEIHPTLANSYITIKALFTKQMDANIFIYNIYGNVVSKENLGNTKAINSSIDIANFASGTYILVLHTDYGRVSQRFVKVE